MDDDARLRALEEPAGLVLEAGTVLARKYRLERPAGFGGMAQLWVAKNEATGAEVCVKLLVLHGDDGDSVERFRREAYAAARLSHRAIVRIFDLMELDANGQTTSSGTPAALAIVMELLHGETLADVLMRRGSLPLDEAVDIALPFLSALAHAHRAGVVHRDLKPENIFLATEPDGHIIPKVLDFGVSKMSVGTQGRPSDPFTLEGVMLGTPSFMSPEQARGSRSVDERSDVFSAGIVLYMMIAGKNPFESDTFHGVVSAIVERIPPPLSSLPVTIWGALEKALQKDPAARYADATEFGVALRRAAGRTSTTESGPQSGSGLAAPSSRGSRGKVPLGGDSHVSVPPVGNAELGDVVSEVRPSTAVPAARRRAVRIVLAVTGASVALVAAAFLRGPEGSSTSAVGAPSATGVSVGSAGSATGAGSAGSETRAGTGTGTGTGAAPSAPPESAMPAAVESAAGRGISADASVGGGGGGAASGEVSSVGRVRPPVGGAAPLPAPGDRAATGAPKAGSGAASPSGFKEPSIVRDPGF